MFESAGIYLYQGARPAYQDYFARNINRLIQIFLRQLLTRPYHINVTFQEKVWSLR